MSDESELHGWQPDSRLTSVFQLAGTIISNFTLDQIYAGDEMELKGDVIHRLPVIAPRLRRSRSGKSPVAHKFTCRAIRCPIEWL